jgi:NifB/MoaA-like Fe-S oxidoreductase
MNGFDCSSRLPSESHYEDYPQIGNGVGSIRQFIEAVSRHRFRMPTIRITKTLYFR